ncbi:TlpA disulfide reductase family protein [Pinibacter soli]|uniref:TlpA disulfide reductase family protein n=1 Tax=Pinibacter soli TaxID=3044211 RepID=A0ABT6RA83_9BACT|nr:TlpA disulfide reductase family protein [Pinibacter soli]MDI3319479.1 TlpA disulfide reductase family protein [Pinibacter soli]
MKYTIVTGLLAFSGLQIQAQTPAGNPFQLKGTLKGIQDTVLYIHYTDASGKNIKDSVRTVKGQFTLKGNISEPAASMLYIKSASAYPSDMATIYLEPTVITAQLQYNQFKDVVVKGSHTQQELDLLNSQLKPVQNKMKPASEAYDKANKIYMEAVKNKKPDAELDSLKNVASNVKDGLDPYYEEMRAINYSFFKEHPNSYITLNNLRYYVSSLPLDSLQALYNKMSPQMQQSRNGKELAVEIEKLRGGSPGSMAKNFTTVDMDGKAISLADYKGKYVLLDFWASWCVPCRKGNPHLKALYAKYKDKGIEFIGISDDDRNNAAWKKAVEKDGLPWKHVLRGLDMDKRMKNEPYDTDISEKFGIHTLPTKILIDPNGKIIGRYSSEEEPLDIKLKEIFGT